MDPNTENAVRQLRNLGLIEHDGRWLFSPTRSTRAWPSARGRFLRLLDQGTSDPPEDLAIETIRSLAPIQKGTHLFTLLKGIQYSESIQPKDEAALRTLRNLNLIEHPSYFLAGARVAYLTDLGAYVLGQLEGD
jgi:hypothetical protein